MSERPQDGWTPLHEAAQRGSKGIAEVLLKAGADVNAKAKDGWTPLHIAVSGKQREVAELLLANHADPNAKNNAGQTPLHLAVQSGQREIGGAAAGQQSRSQRARQIRSHAAGPGEKHGTTTTTHGRDATPVRAARHTHAARGGTRIPRPTTLRAHYRPCARGEA